MTQLMLFDSPSSTPASVPTGLATSTSVAGCGPKPHPPTGTGHHRAVTSTRRALGTASTGLPAPAAGTGGIESASGPQRMGDLARLVLLRYQLLAQRREKIRARTP